MTQTVALIVEYNPFHNGHLHHLQSAQELFPNATILVILNGNFLQRGEPAMVDKFTRTKWALAAGADIVAELPFAFGTQRADIFAKGNVAIAAHLQATHIVYGLEAPITTDNVDELLPNQRLGFFYEQAIQAYPTLTGVPITRIHSSYNDEHITHAVIASATAIRKLLLEAPTTLSQYVPTYVAQTLQCSDFQPVQLADYWPHLHSHLLHTDATIPALLQYGMYENIQKALIEQQDFQAFFTTIHQKHMSRTHTARALTYLLTQTTQAQLDVATLTPWTRILGLSLKGQKHLRYVKRVTDDMSWLIDRPSMLQKPHDVLQYNSMITYALLTNMPMQQAISMEFQSKPIRTDDLKFHDILPIKEQ